MQITVYKFPKNNIIYFQDFQRKVGIPENVDFSIKGSIADSMATLVGKGYGMQGSYGNGAIFIKRDDLKFAEQHIIKNDVSTNAIHATDMTDTIKEEYSRNYITSDYFVNSVCMSYRHDFGLLSDEVKEELRQEAKRWYKAWSDNLWDLSYNKENK